MKRRILRWLALPAAAAMLGGLVVVAAAAPSALALNCTYDAFYAFKSANTGNYAYDLNSQGYLVDDTPSNSFCQLQTGTSGPDFAEWVLKGTSSCITLDYDPGISNPIKIETCDSLASQQWELGDNLGGEKWGEIISGYTHGSQTFLLFDPGAFDGIGGLTEISQPGDTWTLDYTGT